MRLSRPAPSQQSSSASSSCPPLQEEEQVVDQPPSSTTARCRRIVTTWETPLKRKRGVGYAKDGAVQAMKQRVELVQKRRDKNPNIPAQEPLPLVSQLGVRTTQVGDKRGTDIRGIGKCMQREPKKRGGCSCAYLDALVEKQVKITMEKVVVELKEELRKEMKKLVAESVAKTISQLQFKYSTQCLTP